MPPCLKFVLIVLFILSTNAFVRAHEFDADSAYAYTKHLCSTIGPRPMGSSNERAALKWAVEKFKSFGADTAYILTFTEIEKRNGDVLNTNSGTAIGIFRGKTDSSIVIGGHIDSSGKEVPGANDDASGTACAIELARIWSEKPRHYTLVFTAFGGEEQGLVGSRDFVDNYPNIGNVHLMLQIDMSASDDQLIAFLEVKDHQAPQWLVEDAFAVERTLGHTGLYYPTHFFSINNAIGGAGSDHMPFLEKNIPAIDFTAGVINSAIHTPEDKLKFVDKSMLARSGELVDGLLTKYQKTGIPQPTAGHYMLWSLFGGRFFVPSWLVGGIVILSLILGVWAFTYSRKTRLLIPKAERVRFSGSKTLLLLILVAIFVQLGEAFIQLLKGLRYPWLVHIDKYLIFAAIWATGGVWVAAQLSRVWRFSPDPYVYSKRALAILVAFVMLLGIVSFRLAFHPALTLLLMSLAIFVPSPGFKLLMGLLAPIPMFKLMFMEVFTFLARNSIASGFGIDSFITAVLYSAALTAILVIWYLPTIYFYGYILVAAKPFLHAFKRLRHPAFGLLVLFGIFGYGGYLYSFPAYNEMWRASIRLEADYDLRSGESSIKISGNEYFRNVTVKADSFQRTYDERIHTDDLPIAFTADWLQVSGREMLNPGPTDTLRVDWLIMSDRPAYRTTVRIFADSLKPLPISANWGFSKRDDHVLFTWFAEPPDTLRLQATFAMQPGAKLIREIECLYTEAPVPLTITAELADVFYRTTITVRDTIETSAMQANAE